VRHEGHRVTATHQAFLSGFTHKFRSLTRRSNQSEGLRRFPRSRPHPTRTVEADDLTEKGIEMNQITGTEKARRFRVKLEDLLKATAGFIASLHPDAFTQDVKPSYELLEVERRIIRNQLDVLAQFESAEQAEAGALNWTKVLPTEPGWHWFRYDKADWPDLPKSLYAPKMVLVIRQQFSGAIIISDPAEMLCEFAAKDMKGFWAGPLQPPAL
jgi:hypothetical protein